MPFPREAEAERMVRNAKEWVGRNVFRFPKVKINLYLYPITRKVNWRVSLMAEHRDGHLKLQHTFGKVVSPPKKRLTRLTAMMRPCLGNYLLHARARPFNMPLNLNRIKCLEIRPVGLVFTNIFITSILSKLATPFQRLV